MPLEKGERKGEWVEKPGFPQTAMTERPRFSTQSLSPEYRGEGSSAELLGMVVVPFFQNQKAICRASRTIDRTILLVL